MQQKYPARRHRTYAAIERQAQQVRQALGFKHDSVLPGLEIFDSLWKYLTKAGGRDIPLDQAVENLESGIEAEARFEHERGVLVVALSPATYEALEDDLARARFSLFHEVGHAVMHAAELVKLSAMPRHRVAALGRGVYQSLRPYADAEWQANAFAGALAMPAEALARMQDEEHLDPISVSTAFKMSRQCAEIRIRAFVDRREKLLRALSRR